VSAACSALCEACDCSQLQEWESLRKSIQAWERKLPAKFKDLAKGVYDTFIQRKKKHYVHAFGAAYGLDPSFGFYLGSSWLLPVARLSSQATEPGQLNEREGALNVIIRVSGASTPEVRARCMEAASGGTAAPAACYGGAFHAQLVTVLFSCCS
jgi:hypothetical protein